MYVLFNFWVWNVKLDSWSYKVSYWLWKTKPNNPQAVYEITKSNNLFPILFDSNAEETVWMCKKYSAVTMTWCSLYFFDVFSVSVIMSTAKRLVLSLAGRKDSQHTPGASSTRLVGNSLSPGHELDEIAIVSHGETEQCGRVSYGSLSLNGPRYIPGKFEFISLYPFLSSRVPFLCQIKTWSDL